jgi:hypothetical protein
MSISPAEYEWDKAWERISQELYPVHKEQAIDEFTTERLQSFYLKNPSILIPGIEKLHEAGELKSTYPSASLVFSNTSIELFLKASILEPIIYGLVHIDALAEEVVKSALGYTGYDRYKKLVSKLFKELACIEISNLKRANSKNFLLNEASEVRILRNRIIHKGESVTIEQANLAQNVAIAIFNDIVGKMLNAIDLRANNKGMILKK